jgi:hypothetical protein
MSKRLFGFLRIIRLAAGFDALLKTPNPFGQAFPELGNLLGSENEYRHGQNDQQMSRLQQPFDNRFFLTSMQF